MAAEADRLLGSEWQTPSSLQRFGARDCCCAQYGTCGRVDRARYTLGMTSRSVRKLLPFTIGALVLLVTGCGTTTSAASPTGNKNTCHDFAAYESWVQSVKSQLSQTVWIDEQRTLAHRFKADGPTAKSKALASEAGIAVNAIDAKKGEQLANQLNASGGSCLDLGYPPPGYSSSSSS